MKKTVVSLLLLISLAPCVEAAGVRLEQLQEFDVLEHKIGVNVQEEVSGGCLSGLDSMAPVFEGLLSTMGMQVADIEESHLEFAVLIQGFPISGPGDCGVKLLSMVRQVPNMKLLRLPPGSKSTRYRLWTSENLVTGHKSEMQFLLQEQARLDVIEFARALERSKI